MSDFDSRKHDYGIYYRVIGIRARGALGRLFIFKEYWYGRRVDRFYYPYNPRSARQQEWRNYMALGVAEWQTLTPEQKQQYIIEARRFRLYGYHRFLHHYLQGKISAIEFHYLQKEDGEALLQESGSKIIINE